MIELLYPLFGAQPFGSGGLVQMRLLRILQKALEHGKKTRDKFIIGCALGLANLSHWLEEANVSEDKDENAQSSRRNLIQYGEDAKRQYSENLVHKSTWRTLIGLKQPLRRIRAGRGLG